MKYLTLSCALALTLLLSPAADATEATSVAAAEKVSPEEMKDRIRLATDYHDAVNIRDIVNKDIAFGATGLNDADKEAYMKAIQLRLDYDKIEADSIQSMAEIFTVPELKAMIAYYGSPEGKSAQDKMAVYGAKIAPEIRQAIDSAIMDARFGGKTAH